MTGLLTNLKDLFDGSARDNGFLKVENYLKVESGQKICVLSAGKEKFLVSISAKGCQFLTKLEENNISAGINRNSGYSSDVRSKTLSAPASTRKESFSDILGVGGSLKLNAEPKEDSCNYRNSGNMDYIGLKKILR